MPTALRSHVRAIITAGPPTRDPRPPHPGPPFVTWCPVSCDHVKGMVLSLSADEAYLLPVVFWWVYVKEETIASLKFFPSYQPLVSRFDVTVKRFCEDFHLAYVFPQIPALFTALLILQIPKQETACWARGQGHRSIGTEASAESETEHWVCVVCERVILCVFFKTTTWEKEKIARWNPKIKEDPFFCLLSSPTDSRLIRPVNQTLVPWEGPLAALIRHISVDSYRLLSNSFAPTLFCYGIWQNNNFKGLTNTDTCENVFFPESFGSPPPPLVCLSPNDALSDGISWWNGIPFHRSDDMPHQWMERNLQNDQRWFDVVRAKRVVKPFFLWSCCEFCSERKTSGGSRLIRIRHTK